MAATTCGWQCPVEVTAMPAEKSRNSLPSTSSMTTPRPRLTTSGYERVYDGEIYFLSPSRIFCALGPGSLVRIFGPAGDIVCVAIMIPLPSNTFRRVRTRAFRNSAAQAGHIGNREKGGVIRRKEWREHWQ